KLPEKFELEKESYHRFPEHRQRAVAMNASRSAAAVPRANISILTYLGCDTIKAQDAFYDPSGAASASHIDARDLSSSAAALLLNGEHENQAFDMTGPQSLSNDEIAEILTAVVGKPIRYVPVSDDDARQALKASGMPDWMVESLIELIVLKRANK